MRFELILFFIFMLFTRPLLAQDERFFRQVISGELPSLMETPRQELSIGLNVLGPRYRIDLNEDGIEEILIPQKRHGVDWLEIRDHSERVLMSEKLLAMGGESVIYKVRLITISPKVKTLIVYLDEGKTQSKEFKSTARIFLVTFEHNNLEKLTLTHGPHFYLEKEAQREQYLRRKYMVNIYDMDHDGTREVSVEYNGIQRILKYDGDGKWKRI